MKRMDVVFCGNSLYLSMLAFGLQENNLFRICMIDHKPADAMPELKILCPDVLVVEGTNITSLEIDSVLSGIVHQTLVIVYQQTDSIEIVCKNGRRLTTSVDSLTQVIAEAV